MESANVQLVRRAYGAFQADLEAGAIGRGLPEIAHPDIEWLPLEATHPLRGYDGVSAAWQAWAESMEQLDTEPEELVDLGDQVLVTMRLVVRGVSSGATVEERVYPLFTIRDGKIARYVEYSTREDALEACGATRPRP